ncbi:hypothetical protein GCM10010464_10220 [Pseudonocardia yunnanensis]
MVSAQVPPLTPGRCARKWGTRSPRAALIYLHARDHRDREIAAGLDRPVAEARSLPEGHGRGTKGTAAAPLIENDRR